jgi:hypothetical protein
MASTLFVRIRGEIAMHQGRSVLLATGLVIALVTVAVGAGTAREFVITDYGAQTDGKTINSSAIQKAIAACAQAGGGKVVIPAGRFITGPIELQSHVQLHLAPGAVLEASPDIGLYGSGRDKRGLVRAANAADVSVSGTGTIKGRGSAFMSSEPKPLENTTGRHARQGPACRAGTEDGPMTMGRRPGSLVRFARCRNVSLTDVNLDDAPEWTAHFSECDGVYVRGVRIVNNPLIPNNDGIHCVTCRNVRICDCDVRAGDDAIAITSFSGPKDAIAENVIVANCHLQSRSVGVRVGYGWNNIRNCVFQNLVIYGSNRGLGLFVRDEGSISNVVFSDIVIETRLHSGDWWGNGEPIHVSCLPQKADTPPGRIENVRFSNVLAQSEHGIVIYGQKEGSIRNLSLDGISLRINASPKNDSCGGNFDLRPAADDRYTLFAHDIPGLYACGVENLRIHEFTLTWAEGLPDFFSHAIECESFSGLRIDGFTGRQARPGDSIAAVCLRQGRDAVIQNCIAVAGTATFLSHSRVTDARVFGNDLTHSEESARR